MSHLPANGTWSKCPFCNAHVNQLEWGFYKQCPHCHRYLRLTAQQRINQVVDANSFSQIDTNVESTNHLNVPEYTQKLAKAHQQSGLDEAIMPICIGLAASCALLLPISTPPNALAYSTGLIEQKEFYPGGILSAIVGPFIIMLFTLAYFFI